MSDFPRHALRRLIDKATGLGVDVPPEISSLVGHDESYAANRWLELHPGDDRVCCYESAIKGPGYCTCWQPVFDVDQLPAVWPDRPEDLAVRGGMCGDCAYRKGSPERSSEWEEEALLDLPDSGTPFWCHDGMRKPVRWDHPDGRSVPGAADDWKPPVVRGIPFRADGRPGLLCGGWAARAVRSAVRSQ